MPMPGPLLDRSTSREVRPILANYCFPCHGPDDKARKASLRLDVPEGAIEELPVRQSCDRSRQARGERSSSRG